MRVSDKTGFAIPEILLPKKGTDMSRWTCVACDQYTKDGKYWEEAYAARHGAPSAINLMLPEYYLDGNDADERISKINETMDEYLASGVFEDSFTGVVLTLRKTRKDLPARCGLVAALDLEKYDYNKGSGSLIRATEGTVTSRIPPRMKIRKNACIEMPHIMILIDDPGRTVLEPLKDAAGNGKYPLAYDFDLKEGGGHLTGYKITDEESLENIFRNIEDLASRDVFLKKYEKYRLSADTPLLIFPVGDGNHSLASAKAQKKAGAAPDDPARFALCEIVNIHDPGILFEPIHRVLFGIGDIDRFIDEISAFFGERASVCLSVSAPVSYEGCHTISFTYAAGKGAVYIDKNSYPLAVGAMQEFIDFYLEWHPEASVDYIHGDEDALKLGKMPGNIAFLLPAMDKSDLIPYVIEKGALPRKTFSMGEAFEKRYYCECRKIVR